MLKKTMYAMLGMALLFATPSCKKGEEDPFLSLRSRKARVTGEWKLSAYTASQTSNGTVTYSETLNGTVMTDNNGFSRSYSQEFTFEKDNTYQIVTVDDGDSNTEKGNWAFLGKNKDADVKKKEYIYLDETSYSSGNFSASYSNFQSGNGISYQLVKLSNKEIMMHVEISATDGTDSDKTEINLTLTKK